MGKTVSLVRLQTNEPRLWAGHGDQHRALCRDPRKSLVPEVLFACFCFGSGIRTYSWLCAEGPILAGSGSYIGTGVHTNLGQPCTKQTSFPLFYGSAPHAFETVPRGIWKHRETRAEPGTLIRGQEQGWRPGPEVQDLPYGSPVCPQCLPFVLQETQPPTPHICRVDVWLTPTYRRIIPVSPLTLSE